MEPEGYNKKRRQQIIDIYLDWIGSKQNDYKGLSNYKKFKKIEMSYLTFTLAKMAIDHVREYPN